MSLPVLLAKATAPTLTSRNAPVPNVNLTSPREQHEEPNKEADWSAIWKVPHCKIPYPWYKDNVSQELTEQVILIGDPQIVADTAPKWLPTESHTQGKMDTGIFRNFKNIAQFRVNGSNIPVALAQEMSVQWISPSVNLYMSHVSRVPNIAVFLSTAFCNWILLFSIHNKRVVTYNNVEHHVKVSKF